MTTSTARTGWNDPESALAYDQRMIPAVGLPMAEALLRALPPPPDATVPEVASGTDYNFAVETIPDESLRPGVLAEVAALLDARHPAGELSITVRPLVASGWK